MEEYLVNSKDLDGFVKIEKDLSEDKGEVCLVVCLKPKGEDYFDLFIAADWVAKNDINTYMENVEFVGSLLDKYLSVEINTQISTIILLNSAEIFVKDFLAQIHKESSPYSLKELEVNGFEIERAYIIKPYPVQRNASDENIVGNLLSLLDKVQLNERDNFISFLNSLESRKQVDFIKAILGIPSLEGKIAKIKQVSSCYDDPSDEIIKDSTGNYPPYLALVIDNTKPKQAA